MIAQKEGQAVRMQVRLKSSLHCKIFGKPLKIRELIARNKYLHRIILAGTDPRTIRTRKNILYSLMFRIAGAMISVLLVPLTLKYLNPTKYGIWLTLSAVISWLSLFDIGLGAGLRNRFAEALASDDKVKARIYVSTTYTILTVIVVGIYLIFLFVNQYIPWGRLVNAPPEVEAELGRLAFVVFTFFLFRLVFGLIISILTANQRQSMVGFLELLVNLLSLIGVMILPRLIDNSMLAVGTIISAITALVPALASVYFFSSSYRDYSPSIKMVRLKYSRSLISLGFDFFILSITSIIMYFSQNVIISQLFSPAEVSTFNIAYKYFFYIVVIQTLVLNPILPATTDAYFKNDFNWIKNALKKLIYIWAGLVAVILVMVMVSNYAYALWVGNEVKVPFPVSFAMAVYMILFTWYATFAYVINGIGKVKVQLYISVLSSMMMIPLAIFFVKSLNFGVDGVIFAGVLCIIPGSIVIPIQLHKLLNNKAVGLWNK